MATYTITRKHYGSIDNQLLQHLLVSFNSLYVARTNDHTEIQIRGEWPDAFKGDGLYLTYVTRPGKIVKIGRKYVTIEFRNDQYELETVNLELEPGWTEITFITMPREQHLGTH